MERRTRGKNSDHDDGNSRGRSRQQEAQRSVRRDGNSDRTRGAQAAGVVEALLASVRGQGMLVANDNTVMPLSRIDEAANDSRRAPPEARAFKVRVGREELVVISMQAWEPTIVGMLSRIQQKIVRLLMLGMTHKQVADELEIQPQTVANSTSAVYQREDGLADTLEHLVSKLSQALFEIETE